MRKFIIKFGGYGGEYCVGAVKNKDDWSTLIKKKWDENLSAYSLDTPYYEYSSVIQEYGLNLDDDTEIEISELLKNGETRDTTNLEYYDIILTGFKQDKIPQETIDKDKSEGNFGYLASHNMEKGFWGTYELESESYPDEDSLFLITRDLSEFFEPIGRVLLFVCYMTPKQAKDFYEANIFNDQEERYDAEIYDTEPMEHILQWVFESPSIHEVREKLSPYILKQISGENTRGIDDEAVIFNKDGQKMNDFNYAYYIESTKVFKEEYEKNPTTTTAKEYGYSLSHIAHELINNKKEEDFKEAISLYKTFFEVFPFKDKENVLSDFIYPMIKWMAIAKMINDEESIKLIKEYKEKLNPLYLEIVGQETYDKEMQELKESYEEASANNDFQGKEKLEALLELFSDYFNK
jgi:hypothetical protein